MQVGPGVVPLSHGVCIRRNTGGATQAARDLGSHAARVGVAGQHFEGPAGSVVHLLHPLEDVCSAHSCFSSKACHTQGVALLHRSSGVQGVQPRRARAGGTGTVGQRGYPVLTRDGTTETLAGRAGATAPPAPLRVADGPLLSATALDPAVTGARPRVETGLDPLLYPVKTRIVLGLWGGLYDLFFLLRGESM